MVLVSSKAVKKLNKHEHGYVCVLSKTEPEQLIWTDFLVCIKYMFVFVPLVDKRTNINASLLSKKYWS